MKKKKHECVFCKMVNKELPIDVIYDNEDFFSILDANQKTEGHSLVISKLHFDDCLMIPPKLGANFLDCVQKTTMKVKDVQEAEGFNLVSNNGVVAGQAVEHFHCHILPRHKGDKVPRVY